MIAELTTKSNEDDLREFLKKHYEGIALITRLETSVSPGFSPDPYKNKGGIYTRGVYDLHVRSCDADSFIELKRIKIPARSNTKVRLGVRPSQIRWGTDYMKYCGNAYVIAYGHPLIYVVWGNNIQAEYDNTAEFYKALHLLTSPSDLPLDLFSEYYIRHEAPVII